MLMYRFMFLSARSLSSLFNALPDSVTYQTRTIILLSLFTLAISKDDPSILSSAVSSLPSWVSSEWSISSTSEQDSIISQFVTLLEGAKEKEEANELVRKLLYEYTGANTAEELKEKLLFYTIANTSSFHDVDLESLPSSSSNSSLNSLKDIFLSGSVADLDSFYANSSNSDLVSKLEQEKLKEKLQYVILADYCANNVGNDITYEQVADVLGLQNDAQDEEERAMQVEIWVIASEFALALRSLLPLCSRFPTREHRHANPDGTWRSKVHCRDGRMTDTSFCFPCTYSHPSQTPQSTPPPALVYNFNPSSVATHVRQGAMGAPTKPP